MLHAHSQVGAPSSSGNTDAATRHSHSHMVMRESYSGANDSYDLDYHVRHKPLKRRGLSKFYHSKSRSFSSLELACASVYGESARGLAKRQNSGELTATCTGTAAALAAPREAGSRVPSARKPGSPTPVPLYQEGSRQSGCSPPPHDLLEPTGSLLSSEFQAPVTHSSPQVSFEPRVARALSSTLHNRAHGPSQPSSSTLCPLSTWQPPPSLLGQACHVSMHDSGAASSSGDAGSHGLGVAGPTDLGVEAEIHHSLATPVPFHARMSNSPLSTSAPEGLLAPTTRYSTEELCAALQSTSIARAEAQQSKRASPQRSCSVSASIGNRGSSSGSVGSRAAGSREHSHFPHQQIPHQQRHDLNCGQQQQQAQQQQEPQAFTTVHSTFPLAPPLFTSSSSFATNFFLPGFAPSHASSTGAGVAGSLSLPPRPKSYSKSSSFKAGASNALPCVTEEWPGSASDSMHSWQPHSSSHPAPSNAGDEELEDAEASAKLSDEELETRISEEPDVLPSSGIDEGGLSEGVGEERGELHSDGCMQCDWSQPNQPRQQLQQGYH